ncbi:hypothetical protein YB2330_004928 [Saitoella coloradoensis]
MSEPLAFLNEFPEDLRPAVEKLIISDMTTADIFIRLSSYIASLKAANSSSNTASDGSESSSKKRKLDTPAPTATSNVATSDALLTIKDVSFTAPQRKKLALTITPTHLVAHVAGGNAEFTIELNKVASIACLPVPDKAARQWSFCIFPAREEGKGDAEVRESIVFTVPDRAPKQGAFSGSVVGFLAESDTKGYVSLVSAVLRDALEEATKLVTPDASEFVSAIPQAHRKGEKAYHVAAHRGSKDGYLFFLDTGVVFGFKRPVVLFELDRIRRVTYTSVLQRTFNVVFTIAKGGDEEEDVEFSMLDQGDYPGVDRYIKKHDLTDASLSAARKAKTELKSELVNGEIPDKEMNRIVNEVTKSITGNGPVATSFDKMDLDDDDEEDDDFEGNASDDDIAEEYDSDVSGHTSDDDEDEEE